jgi:hypothetical protein
MNRRARRAAFLQRQAANRFAFERRRWWRRNADGLFLAATAAAIAAAFFLPAFLATYAPELLP